MIKPSMRDDGFLFSDGKGGCWKTDIQTKAMIDFTTRWAKFRCTSQMYRHIAKAFSREFIRGRELDDGRDDDEPTVDAKMAVHDLANAHGLRNANIRYGLTSDMIKGLNSFMENLYRDVGDKCHWWLKLQSRLPRIATSNDVLKDVGDDLSLINRCEGALRELFGNEAEWRSDTQREAVHAIIEGQSPVVVILPTAGGKSACIWIPAKLDEGDKTTIVVVPLVELARDIVKKCKDHKIPAIHWESGEERMAKVVVVTTNMHNTSEFHKYAAALYETGSLPRMIYDEVHFCLTSS
jgi:DEAD/DEAH box helicase